MTRLKVATWSRLLFGVMDPPVAAILHSLDEPPQLMLLRQHETRRKHPSRVPTTYCAADAHPSRRGD